MDITFNAIENAANLSYIDTLNEEMQRLNSGIASCTSPEEMQRLIDARSEALKAIQTGNDNKILNAIKNLKSINL